MSLRVFWDSIYELCQESVHREGVDPNSMEGVRDLNHIGVENIFNIACHTFIKMPAHMEDEFTKMRTITRWTARGGDMGELNMIMENVFNIACHTFIKMPAHIEDEFMEMWTILRWTARGGIWGWSKVVGGQKKVVQSCPKLSIVVNSCQNLSMSKAVQSCQKLFKAVKSWQKLAKAGKSWQELSKDVITYHKLSKAVKSCQKPS